MSAVALELQGLLEQHAERVAEKVVVHVRDLLNGGGAAPWMDTKQAAAYAACSVPSLHKAMAAREVRFSQRGPGGKAWFRPEWIDEWRGVG